MTNRIVLAVPGALAQRTGGYLYAQRVVDGLRAMGREVRVAELGGCFPQADEAARVSAEAMLALLKVPVARNFAFALLSIVVVETPAWGLMVFVVTASDLPLMFSAVMVNE